MTIIALLFGAWLVYIAVKEKFTGTTKQKGKIETEMIPFQMHGKNVRSRISSEQWQRVAKATHKYNFQQTGIKGCEVCESNGREQGFPHTLEAHEEWLFNYKTRTQRLTRIRSLCPLCHKSVHYGLAKSQGFEEAVYRHMMEVNGWSGRQVEDHVEEATDKVKELSKGSWKLDLTLLNEEPYQSILQEEFTKDEARNCRKNEQY